MAMIVELLDARGGVRVRVRVHSLPFTIGRGLDNDLILDDPYADAHHARITLDPGGALVLHDLGSTNGLLPSGARSPADRVPATAGTQVRIGRTLVRFRETTESVPAALPARGAPAPGTGGFLADWRGRLPLMALGLATVGLWSWFDSYGRNPGAEVLAMIAGFGFLGVLWAGGWALGGRIVGQRFQFGAHFALFSLALVIAMAMSAGGNWLAFLFPGSRLVGPAAAITWFVALALLLVGHLRFASGLVRRRRWRNAIIATTLLYAVSGLFALAAREPFTDVPTFSGLTRPLAARWIPTTGIDGFVAGSLELREAVDALAAPE